MFEKLKIPEKPSLPQELEFITLYTRFDKGLAWLNSGERPYKDKVDFYRLTQAMDEAWGRLAKDQRKRCAMELVNKGILPQGVATGIVTFNAEVVSIH